MTSTIANSLEDWLTGASSNSSNEDHVCKWILYQEISDSRIRIIDLTLFIPNFLFLAYLAKTFNLAQSRLKAANRPVILVFYFMVLVASIVGFIRCVVGMCVNAADPAGDIIDKLLWVAVRFFMLFTEISVLVFYLTGGRLDTVTSIKRVLFVTSFVALLYSGSQGALEIIAPDQFYFVRKKNKGVFGHGGVLFWFASSIVFTAVYSIVLALPFTRLRNMVPARKPFCWYILFLVFLNLIQAIGSGILFFRMEFGLCIVNITELIYFISYLPLVYIIFLAHNISSNQSSIFFSYKPQIDELVDEDTVSLPHQLSCSSLKTDSDFIYQNASAYDSTHFDASNVNPLYIHSLQSPDSVTPSIDNAVSPLGAPKGK